MRYRVEYLMESTEEDSVCHTLPAHARNLLAAGQAAWAGEAYARLMGASGFQIRDMIRKGRIVALETFDLPPPYLH